MRKFINQLVVIVTLLLSSVTINSQTTLQKSQLNPSKDEKSDSIKISRYRKQHALSFYSGFGLSSGKFEPTFGKTQNGGGMLIGVDYIFNFHKHWSLTAGIDFYSYSADFKADGITTQTTETDSQNHQFELYSTYSGWIESQKLYTLGLPITIRYNVKIGQKWNFFVSTGFRSAFATGGYSQVSDGVVNIKAYYPIYNVWYYNLEKQGFNEQTFRSKKDSETKVNFSSISDIGFNIKLNQKWALYAAAYFEYGLLNLKDKSYTEPLIAYDGTTDTPYYNFVPYSNTMDKSQTIAIGGKVGVILTLGKPIESTQNKQKTIIDKKKKQKNSESGYNRDRGF